jgi:hypothetical protein
MMVDQRFGGGSATATADTYCVDRWAIGYGGPVNAFTAIRSTTAPVGFKNSLLLTAGTGASAGAAGYAYLRQMIEGLNIYDLDWGTANAQSITISFWVRSSLTGTFGILFRNSGGSRAYGATYVISSANTWEQKTITIPGDTGGTWLTTTGVGIGIYFDLGIGSNYEVSSGSWQAFTNALGVSSTTKLTATTSANLYITGVQVEKGSTASAFEFRLYGHELELCRRYYEILGETTNSLLLQGYGGGVESIRAPIFYSVNKRVQPSVSLVGSFSYGNSPGSAFVANAGIDTTRIEWASSGVGQSFVYNLGGGIITNDAEM